MVVGMAGVLDSSRFRYFLADEFNVSVEDVTAFVLGGHGDTMVPLTRYSTVAGIPAARPRQDGLDHAGALDEIVKRTRDGGAEIVNLLKTGSAFYAPAAPRIADGRELSARQEARAALRRLAQRRIRHQGLYVGVPVVLGAKGVETHCGNRSLQRRARCLEKSAASVQTLVDACKKIAPDRRQVGLSSAWHTVCQALRTIFYEHPRIPSQGAAA
jgi:malate dehydrogenase